MVARRKTTKLCPRCEEVKSFSAFCKGKTRYGLASWCKMCVAAKKKDDRKDPAKKAMNQARDRRWNNSPTRRAWSKQDILSGRHALRHRKAGKRYYEKNREKILARRKVARQDPKRKHQQKCHLLISLMVYFGMIEREPCKVCGTAEKVEAAHRSYDDPLNFFWACPLHHRHYDHGYIDEDGNVL